MSSGSTDFPRDWQYFADEFGSATALSITVPAIIGVSHVLTSVVAQMNSSSTVDQIALVTITFGSTAVWSGQLNAFAPVAPVAHSSDTLSWDGALIANPFVAITVAFSTANSTLSEFLTIQGYDI